MVKLSFYLDTRRYKGNAVPLRLIIRHRNSSASITLPVKAIPEQWDEQQGKLKSYPKNKRLEHPRKEKINDYLTRLMLDCEDAVRGLPINSSAPDLKTAILKAIGVNTDTNTSKTFVEVFTAYAHERNAENTQNLYMYTLSVIQAYDHNIGPKLCTAITSEWIKSFFKWLERQGLSGNTIWLHFSHLRAVLKHAHKCKYINDIPVADISIRRKETAKRSLSVSQIRYLYNLSTENVTDRHGKKLPYFADIFLLSIYLRGIRPVDLANLTDDNVINNRLEYTAQKTGTNYSIKLEPEALAIINRHKGKRHLIDILDKYTSYQSFFKSLNKSLRNIGISGKFYPQHVKMKEKALFPKISAYWARHSWATIAAELEIPIETISHGLGHMIGGDITLVYVAYRQSKVDDANRKIIDYILNVK